MTFDATVPQFELKAAYQMKGRQLTLTLQEGSSQQGRSYSATRTFTGT